MGISRVYLDSYYILEILNKGAAKKEVERLLSALSKSSFEIFIPQVVLGEVLSNLLRQSASILDEKLNRLPNIITKYNIDPDSCLTPPRTEMFDIMTKLKDNDTYLDGTDIIITSQALADPDSKFFFTSDSRLIENTIILEFEENMRSEGSRNQRLEIKERL